MQSLGGYQSPRFFKLKRAAVEAKFRDIQSEFPADLLRQRLLRMSTGGACTPDK